MEKQIEVNGKTYTIKEIPYVKAFELDTNNKVESARVLLKYSAGLTDAEIDALTMKEGIQIQQHINELNGLNDFQKLQLPEEEKKN